MLYLFSDGYADQFGGKRGKKFKSNKLKELLMEVSSFSIADQHESLETKFIDWKGDFEQVDDVCIMGIRI